jgi:hypothetical protein
MEMDAVRMGGIRWVQLIELRDLHDLDPSAFDRPAVCVRDVSLQRLLMG